METPIGEDVRQDKVQKILESRGIGRTSGTCEDKKKQHLKLLNEGKKNQQNLKLYHITKLKKIL